MKEGEKERESTVLFFLGMLLDTLEQSLRLLQENQSGKYIVEEICDVSLKINVA